jgi:hypothetical protein
MMTEYRTVTVNDHGHLIASRAFMCDNDADAIVWAKQLVDRHDMELWSGERLVRRLDKKLHSRG